MNSWPQSDPAAGGLDRSLALAGDQCCGVALAVFAGVGEPDPLALVGAPLVTPIRSQGSVC